jgi:O-antigen/teichoic acid export membrane protein
VSFLTISQFATLSVQIIYAAITSRLVDISSFGSYAVGLSIAGFFSVMSTGGIGQVVSRMQQVSSSKVAALSRYSLLIGIGTSGVMMLTAGLSASYWGSYESISVLAVLSVFVAVSPLLGLQISLSRREGRISQLSLLLFFTSFFGFFVGLFCVFLYSSAASLAISATVAQVSLLFSLIYANRRESELPPLKFSAISEELLFIFRSSGIRFLEFFNGNIIRLAIARHVGLESLGILNRAEVLSIIPGQKFYAVINNVLEPEFRGNRSTKQRAFVIWSDVLVLSSWVVIPCVIVGATVAPKFTRLILGQGWDEVNHVLVPLILLVGVQALSSLLGTAMHIAGLFKNILVATIVHAVFQAAGFLVIMNGRDLTLGINWMLFSAITYHFAQIAMLTSAGFLSWIRITRHYLSALAIGGLATPLLLIALYSDLHWALRILAAMVPIISVGIAIRIKGSQFEWTVVARKYGFLK